MNIALILAGGTGLRMNHSVPKQFIELDDKPVIIYTLEFFIQNKDTDKIITVVHEDWVDHLQKLFAKYRINDCQIVLGGITRQQSTYHGLLHLKKTGVQDDDLIIIHDAVRPFLNDRIISDSIIAAREHGAADVCVKTHDTIVHTKKNLLIKNIPKRDIIYNGQTPQTFKFSVIHDVHTQAIRDNFTDTTDDCKIALHYRQPVKIVIGEYENIKLTTPADLDLAYRILEKRKPKDETKI